MLWPLPSPSPSRLIDTAVAGPVTTTWKDSNSFLAAAVTAVADAPCGGCALGRTFTAAGAVQTWAASEALPARNVTAAAAIWESFMVRLLGWLLSGTASAFRSGRPTKWTCRLFPSRCPAVGGLLRVCRENGGRCPRSDYVRAHVPPQGLPAADRLLAGLYTRIDALRIALRSARPAAGEEAGAA